MGELDISLDEFESWLVKEHYSSFRDLGQIKEFVNQGLIFLFVSGSTLLRSFIIRKVGLFKKQEGLLKTAEGQGYWWWIFAQAVREFHGNHNKLKIIYEEKFIVNPYKKYSPFA